LTKSKFPVPTIKEISRELYPKEWNPSINEIEGEELGNT
jgi:hypothetical protein